MSEGLVGLGLKALGSAFGITFPRPFPNEWGSGNWGGNWRKSPRFDYQAAVGSGAGSSAVVACLNAIGQGFAEAPLRVYQYKRDASEEVIPDHPLSELFARPNPVIPSELLWKYAMSSVHLTGDAYLIKARAGRTPKELWPIGPQYIAPKWDDKGKDWISYYEYKPYTNGAASSSGTIKLDPNDVVHLKLDLDPDNPRKGRSPMASLFKEIFTDEEAAAFTSALLRNMGVPGVILTPDGDGDPPSPQEAEAIKRNWKRKFDGDQRGEPVVAGGKFKVQVLSFSPTQMDYSMVRMIPESRVTAVMGVPAIIAGLLVGLEHGTYNNVEGLRKLFTEQKLVPLWRLIAAQIAHSLGPDFGIKPNAYTVKFDLTDVRALQENEDSRIARLTTVLKEGGMTLQEFRRELGLPDLPKAKDEFFMMPSGVSLMTVEMLETQIEQDLEALKNPPPAPAALNPDGTPIDPNDPNAPPPPEDDGTGKKPPPGKPAAPRPPAVPPKKSLGILSADDIRFQSAILRERNAMARQMATKVEGALVAIADRTERRFEAWLAANPDTLMENAERLRAAGLPGAETKADNLLVTWDLEKFVPHSEDEFFADLLQDNAHETATAAYKRVAKRLRLDLEFNPDSTRGRMILNESSARASRIMGTMRKAIERQLNDGVANGESSSDLAVRVRSTMEGAYKNQGHAIGKTEVGHVQNVAVVDAYRTSGKVNQVLVLDGVDFDDECANANGQIWTFAYAESHSLQHPNCTRTFVPIERP